MKKIVVVVPIPMSTQELAFEGGNIEVINNEEGVLIVKDYERQDGANLAVFNRDQWNYWRRVI